MRSFERVRRGHPAYAGIAGHFGLDRLASPVGACVSVARVRCVGGARNTGSSTMPLATTRVPLVARTIKGERGRLGVRRPHTRE
eukprot:6126475-Prymnesium_polylepis.1